MKKYKIQIHKDGHAVTIEKTYDLSMDAFRAMLEMGFEVKYGDDGSWDGWGYKGDWTRAKIVSHTEPEPEIINLEHGMKVTPLGCDQYMKDEFEQMKVRQAGIIVALILIIVVLMVGGIR